MLNGSTRCYANCICLFYLVLVEFAALLLRIEFMSTKYPEL